MIGQLPLLPMAPATPGAPAAAGDPAQADFSRWLAPGAAPAAPGLPPLPAPEPPAWSPPMVLAPGAGPGVTMPLPTDPLVSAPLQLQVQLPEADALRALSPDGAPIRLAWAVPAPRADGVVELVATLWQLTAGDRLSQQQAAPLLQAGLTAAAPGSAPTAPGAVAATALPAPVSDVAGMPRRPTGTLEGLAFVAAAQRTASAASPGNDPAGAGTALLGASHAWPLRLLRWLNEGPQGATAWLRDFTLTPDASSALVDDLRRFAAAEKLPLDRIVLNGRTLWAADHATSPTP